MSDYLQSLEEALNDSLIQCRTWGTDRIKINYAGLPDERKNEFGDSKDEDEYYLHCPTCDTYSAIGATHYSPSFEPRKQIKFKAAPARNAPCPCGSGKQYKRCHGK